MKQIEIPTIEFDKRDLYDCADIAQALGLKGARMVIEQARKHFANDIPVDKLSAGVKLPQGGRTMGRSTVMLNKEQTEFIVSRSRGDTAKACAALGLSVNYHSLYRGEQLMMSLVESILSVTQYKLTRQYSIDRYLYDGVVVGQGAAIAIEYDERQHKYSSEQDNHKQLRLMRHFADKSMDAALIRVTDTSLGISSACKAISGLVHSDFLGPVEYNYLSESYDDCSVMINDCF